MDINSRIYIAGHRGMVGSAIVRGLQNLGFNNLLLKSSKELDLRNQSDVNLFFKNERPDYVFLAAAKVGGILANRDNKAGFFYDNLMIATNVIQASYIFKVKKLLNLGSSCIYPKLAKQPLKEECLLTGALEETNDAYAIAKISAIKMCNYYNCQYDTNFLSIMPTNLYGFNDNFDLTSSHVLPAMIRKFHEAKLNNTEVTLWGDGSPFREFLFADDLADAAIYVMKTKNANDLGEFVNVGTGKDLTIKNLAEIIANVVEFKGVINWDDSKPNGTPKKLLDVTKLHQLGWDYTTELKDGISKTYNHFLTGDIN